MTFQASGKSGWRSVKTSKMRKETVKNLFDCIRVILIRTICVCFHLHLYCNVSGCPDFVFLLYMFYFIATSSFQWTSHTTFECREVAQCGLGCHPDLGLELAALFIACVALGNL